MTERKFPDSFESLPVINYMAVANFDLYYRNTWHYSHYSDLIYIISGNMTVVLPGTHEMEYPVNSGEILLMQSNIKHKDLFIPSKGLKSLVISYIWDGDKDFMPADTPVRKFEKNDLPEIHSILEHIRENCNGKNRKDSNLLMIQQSRLHSALLLLYNLMNGNFAEKPASIFTYKPENLLAAAEYYIRCNYSSPDLNKTEVANHLSVSVATLTRAFERCRGYTFVEYLTTIRLEAAQRLLAKGNCRISEAALLCGFADAGYFARVFKKSVGISPSEYR